MNVTLSLKVLIVNVWCEVENKIIGNFMLQIYMVMKYNCRINSVIELLFHIKGAILL